MEIIGGSLKSVAENFLHAGYMSASPRTFASMGAHRFARKAEESEVELIDVESALKTEESNQTAQVLPAPQIAWGMAPAKRAVSGAVGIAVIGLILTILVWQKFRFAWLRILVTTGFVLACSVCGLVALATVVFSGPHDWRKQIIVVGQLPSWKELDRLPETTYLDPSAATSVILHGIIPDALTSRREEVTTLAEIRDEIALPTNRLTPGILYALQNYDRDGWGTRLRLELKTKRNDYGFDEIYGVHSAGPDREFGTADDLVKEVNRSIMAHEWDRYRNSFFIRENGGQRYLMVHRFPSRLFLYSNNRAAITMTSSELFDAVDLGKLRFYDGTDPKLGESYSELAQASPCESPMALIIFRPKKEQVASEAAVSVSNEGG